MTQGERITTLRKELNIKQGDFAKRILTTQGHISDIENSRKNLTERTIKLICDEFNVNYYWLHDGTGEMFTEPNGDLTLLLDDIVAGDNEFAKGILKAFTKFSNDDWLSLEKIVDKISIEIKKEPTE